jgi:membrane protease YdiL (CAAX protease family)
VDAPPDLIAPPPVPRPSSLTFFAIILGLFAALGTAAQASNPAFGLAWSEIFALLLPALLAATGWNLAPDRALLLSTRPGGRPLGLALVFGCSAFFAAGALMALTSLLVPARWVEAFDVTRAFTRGGMQRTLLALIATTIAPFCEEVAFRGWILTALRIRHRPVFAILGSALLFALMHLDPVRFVALFALGTGYGWLAWRSGSIWPSVLAHATNNGLGVLVASAGAAAGGLHGPSGAPGEIAASAVLMLALSGSVVVLVARAYERATPGPPDVSEIVRLRDPADPSSRFAARRIPSRLLALAVTGGLLLVLIVVTGHAIRR